MQGRTGLILINTRLGLQNQSVTKGNLVSFNHYAELSA